MENHVEKPENNELYILWTSGDKEVALSMAFMYTFNSKTRGWWDDVTLIVWGASAKLLATDDEIQGRVSQMIEAGVHVTACVACAQMYGVAEILVNLGIDVKPMGIPLTDLLKSGKKVLSI
ncbi:DsrE family protein [Pelosinus sp. sgz500959]|uniref:DsrE family protein n=1 Tax=Pelosinus sp. sgz500959 TaxID=3242472 RepID=UPI00366C0AC2